MEDNKEKKGKRINVTVPFDLHKKMKLTATMVEKTICDYVNYAIAEQIKRDRGETECKTQ